VIEKISVEEISRGQDPSLLLDLSKDGIFASLTISLHFEGDWSNIYDDEDETENEARDAVSAEIFRLILNQFK
jgi:hypothetical protein